MNRTRLLNMKPVYGVNLRSAIKVNLVFSVDLYESKRHKYVDRMSKFEQAAVDECFAVPSAVFNAQAVTRRRLYGCGGNDDYVAPGCRVTDIEDTVTEGVLIGNDLI